MCPGVRHGLLNWLCFMGHSLTLYAIRKDSTRGVGHHLASVYVGAAIIKDSIFWQSTAMAHTAHRAVAISPPTWPR